MNSNDIRKKFLDYFAARGHKIVPSDSLIPSGDPTLLFTSAGMVQFKKHFLGQSKDTFTRATTCQKSFRTSDIDQVGKTNRHLTFFEMLGNFSFGDYFKQDAIAWGWEFLTKEMSLPADKLYITIYKDDNEAHDIWKKIIPESRIIRMGEETNFWNMGPTGPCGPCSELLFDLGPEMSCGKPDCGPACSCNRYLEVWNLVFTQYDRQENGELKNLPRKNIDTGMGFERLVAVANGKDNVFENDLFEPIINNLADFFEAEPSKHKEQYRMMADHARAITFLIADGILPSNEGRGYVLRRILRRALRQGKLFGINEPFLYKVTAQAADLMKQPYPDLAARRENISSITKMEEEKFLETLEAGTRMLDELISRHSGTHAAGKNALGTKFMIPGNEAFKLYDTYGFPLDLTREIASEKGLSVDEEGFKTAQSEAQSKSRSAWSGSGEKDVTFYSKLHKELGDTEFTGYDNSETGTNIKAIIINGKLSGVIKEGEEGEIILAKTPFYAESGGQVADMGTISGKDGSLAEVIDVQKPSGALIIHRVKIKHGNFLTDNLITAIIDKERRKSIARHHTATHLLHKALREILGTHVTQAGSLVTPDYFRFDFTHFSGLKQDEITLTETMVYKAILDNMPVVTTHMNIAEARKQGAMALFGEKYGEEVRSVCVKAPGAANHFSLELCGGTHVSRTGDIGFFKITAESSVAAGTRRIEGVAGHAAEVYVYGMQNILEKFKDTLKSSAPELPERLLRVIARQKDMEKEISKLKSQLASGGTADLMKEVIEINGTKVLAVSVSGLDAESLRNTVDSLKAKIGSGIIILFNNEGDKLSFTVGLTPDASAKGLHAGKIAKNIAKMIGGSGAGRPEYAQGGGKDVSKIGPAIQNISEALKTF